MLESLRGRHIGKKVAILGSGPSLKDFFHRQACKEEVVIGVNGAGTLLQKGDYLVSSDERAAKRSWFQAVSSGVARILRPISAMYSPEMYPDEAWRQTTIKTYEQYVEGEHARLLKGQPTRLEIKPDGFKVVLPGDEVVDRFFENFPMPVEPHHLISGVTYWGLQSVSRDQQRLIVGGSSSCLATQVAYVMGASEIHLYGVEFSNPGAGEVGGNYFYQPAPGETGMTTENHPRIMDLVVGAIRQQGTPIYSHGPTKLQFTIKETDRKLIPVGGMEPTT